MKIIFGQNQPNPGVPKGRLRETAQTDAQRAEFELLMLRAAELNDAEVMQELAWEYSSDGDSLRENVPAAIYWCERSLQVYPDDADLHYLLAENLLKSGDAATVRERAYSHYAKAAALDHARAVRMLGRAWAEGWAYEQGVCMPANPARAQELYTRADALEKRD